MSKKKVLFTDFDGTLYDPSPAIVLSPFYGVQLSRILRKHHMSFIVTTGRADWTWFDDLQLMLLGFHKPEIVICGTGTYILKRMPDKSLQLDEEWYRKIRNTKVIWMSKQKKEQTWNREEIVKTIDSTLTHWNLSVRPSKNQYMIDVPLYNMQVKHVHNCMASLKKLWKSGIEVTLAEKIYLPNTLDIFNGYLRLIPASAGKDLSAKYVMKKYFQKNIEAIFVGDAVIDVPMLHADMEQFTKRAYSYGVHMTPLARENLKMSDPQSKVVHTDGSAPKAFLKVLKAYVSSRPIAAQRHARIVE